MRLHQAHRLWHQVLGQYQDPEGFCVNLNAAIECLRTITFLVQKDQRAIPDFERWYEGWRDRLRQDPTMRWLIEARNRIEKQGDLDTYSSARVSILRSSDEPTIVDECEVSPLLSTEEIAIQAADRSLPREVREDGVLIVERRWVVGEMQAWEALDLLAYCYGVLATVVADAHEQCGYSMRTFSEESHQDVPVRSTHLGGRLPCMVTTASIRSIRIHLTADAFATPIRVRVEPDAEGLRAAAARYADLTGVGRRAGEDILGASERWAEHAKQVLAKDRYHRPLALLETPDGASWLRAFAFADPQSVNVLMAELADEIERRGVTGLLCIAEFWEAPADRVGPEKRAGDVPERREALLVVSATSVWKNSGVLDEILTRCRRRHHLRDDGSIGRARGGDALEIPGTRSPRVATLGLQAPE